MDSGRFPFLTRSQEFRIVHQGRESRSRRVHSKKLRHSRATLQIERLEDRTLLSTDLLTGSGTSTTTESIESVPTAYNSNTILVQIPSTAADTDIARTLPHGSSI